MSNVTKNKNRKYSKKYTYRCFEVPEKLFKIGEVINTTGISRQTIHNYTVMGLINPVKRTKSGHRLYDESVFIQLDAIHKLKRHRTLKEVKKLITK